MGGNLLFSKDASTPFHDPHNDTNTMEISVRQLIEVKKMTKHK